MRPLPTVAVLLALLLALGLLYAAAGARTSRLYMPLVLRNAPLLSACRRTGPPRIPA